MSAPLLLSGSNGESRRTAPGQSRPFAAFSAEQIESTGARVAPALRPEMRPILSSAILGNHGFKSPYFAEILDTQAALLVMIPAS
jgi:hypothetical protein